MTLTVGSLFAGIGGIDRGLERAGMKVLWQVEIDKWCRAVLAKHWPEVERFEDVRSVGGHNLRRVDLIAGGFPCQDISGAGKGQGISGARSGLWAEYARIIGELRPRYVLVENVALLKRRGLEVVLADLAARGYDAEWDCIPASAVGAPHQRDRLWLVATRVSDAHSERSPERGERPAAAEEGAGRGDGGGGGGGMAGEVSLRGSREGAGDDRRGDVAHASESVGRGTAWAGWRIESARDVACEYHRNRSEADGQWFAEPAVGRVAHGIPKRVDRLRGLGNAVVPQVVEWVGRRIVAADGMTR